MYSSLLGYRIPKNSFGILSGLFNFTNLVPANATNHTRTRWQQFLPLWKKQIIT